MEEVASPRRRRAPLPRVSSDAVLIPVLQIYSTFAKLFQNKGADLQTKTNEYYGKCVATYGNNFINWTNNGNQLSILMVAIQEFSVSQADFELIEFLISHCGNNLDNFGM